MDAYVACWYMCELSSFYLHAWNTTEVCLDLEAFNQTPACCGIQKQTFSEIHPPNLVG